MIPMNCVPVTYLAQFADEAAAQAHWAQVLPPGAHVDIILTHGPPHGYGDLHGGGLHVGDRALLAAVQGLVRPPLLWLCGHIHAAYGTRHWVPHPKVS